MAPCQHESRYRDHERRDHDDGEAWIPGAENIQEAQDPDGQPVRDIDFHGEFFVWKNWGISAYGAREFETGVWRQEDFGIVYRDQCIRIEILYNRNDTNNGVLGPSQGVGIRLSLATFGNSDYPHPDSFPTAP